MHSTLVLTSFVLISVIATTIFATPVPQEPVEASNEDFDIDHEIQHALLEDIQEKQQQVGLSSVQHVAGRKRVRRQSEGALGGFLQNVGGRFSTMRDSFRDTMRPVAQAMNPRPAVETMGRWMQTSASNVVNRGREGFQSMRDVGSRGATRIREGFTDAWDGVRDTWEDFWDL